MIHRVGDRARLEYPIGTVLEEYSGWLSHPRLAPDGRTIAYFEHPERGDNAGRLILLDVASRKKTIGPTFGGFTSFAWISSDRLIAGGGNGILRNRLSLRGRAPLPRRPGWLPSGRRLRRRRAARPAVELAPRDRGRRGGRTRAQPDVARLVLSDRPFGRRPVPPVRRTVSGPGGLPLLHPQDRRLAGNPSRKGQGIQPVPRRSMGFDRQRHGRSADADPHGSGQSEAACRRRA